MVAFRVAAAVVAFEPGRSTFQYRLARARQLILDTLEGVFRAARKALRQLCLVDAQHIDHVMGIAAEDGHAVGQGAQAPQHQRWRQRDGIEGAGREAAKTAIGQARGDYRDAGGKLRQCLAEMCRIECLRWRAGRACVHGRPVLFADIMPKIGPASAIMVGSPCRWWARRSVSSGNAGHATLRYSGVTTE